MLAAVCLQACVQPRPAAPAAAAVQRVWPSPPAEPRIAYVRSFTGPVDLGVAVSRWRRVLNFVTGLGGKSENLVKPFGLALDEADNLCLTDTGAGVVAFFDRTEKSYQRWEQLKQQRFILPVAAAVAQGRIYVADSGLKEILVFNRRGQQLFTIKAGLARPSGLAIHGAKLYVADAVGHCVQVFDLDGNFRTRFGQRGTAAGEFNYPTHLATDDQGRLFVTDSMNGRIQVFDADGHFQVALGCFGDRPGQFGTPKGVAVDRLGHVYVADARFDHIQVFDLSGRLLLTWGATGGEPGEFWLPEGLAISRANEIYVADSYNQRVQVFKYIGAP
ncbi:MAG: 6-bladed beta-propeller [Kiritimatiellaeota bacterium]|nr:6-bladed beta-propeller [Kiritimatiellota bacterium]